MALLQIKSANPGLSYILMKNPATGMLIKSTRQGKSFGWFSDENTYNVFFKDSDTEVSYKRFEDESFEYVNTSRYSSAMFVVNTLSDFFASAVKKVSEKDVIGHCHEIKVKVKATNSKYFEIFSQTFKDFEIKSEEVASKTYRIVFSTEKRTLHDLLNFVNLFAIFIVLKNDEDFIMIDEGIVKKYLAAIQIVDAPYFLRYVFKVNLLRSPKLFEQFKIELEKSNLEQIILEHGNTSDQRQNAILKRIISGFSIMDLGCGEGWNTFSCAKKIANIDGGKVHAIDIDAEMRDRVQFKAKKKQLEDVIKVYDSYDQFLLTHEDEDYVALMMEIVEHMPLEEAKQLVGKVLLDPNCKQLLLTTPNKSFNVNYFHGDSLRHEDHHFEFLPEEFYAWIESLVPQEYEYAFFGIGDIVNDQYTTLAVDILRKSK
jgi:2-polyprenyl-3-methyl-5-hydroxy-6-metoxy-1,4-benzoquinol methylase